MTASTFATPVRRFCRPFTATFKAVPSWSVWLWSRACSSVATSDRSTKKTAVTSAATRRVAATASRDMDKALRRIRTLDPVRVGNTTNVDAFVILHEMRDQSIGICDKYETGRTLLLRFVRDGPFWPVSRRGALPAAREARAHRIWPARLPGEGASRPRTARRARATRGRARSAGAIQGSHVIEPAARSSGRGPLSTCLVGVVPYYREWYV